MSRETYPSPMRRRFAFTGLALLAAGLVLVLVVSPGAGLAAIAVAALLLGAAQRTAVQRRAGGPRSRATAPAPLSERSRSGDRRHPGRHRQRTCRARAAHPLAQHDARQG